MKECSLEQLVFPVASCSLQLKEPQKGKWILKLALDLNAIIIPMCEQKMASFLLKETSDSFVFLSVGLLSAAELGGFIKSRECCNDLLLSSCRI